MPAANRYTDLDPLPLLRRQQALRAQLDRFASSLDAMGKPEAPVTLPCDFVSLCKLGLPSASDRSFLYGRHVVRAVKS